MDLRSIVLIPVLALTFFQHPEGHSPTVQKTCAPGVSFWKLLEAVNVGYQDGRLQLDTLYAVCLPAPSRQSTSNYPYDPDSGGKLSTLVKTADGKVLNTYVWYAESIGGLWELSRYKVVGGYEAVKPLAAGSYLLEFASMTSRFTGFRFQSRWERVTIHTSPRVIVTSSKARGMSTATFITSATIRNRS